MSYSLSGSVITQASGTTDADLSGLASITGVTVFNDGVRDLYILDNLQLLILGTQTINPFNECIFTQNWSAQYNVRNDGTLTINGYRNYFGRLQYSRQPWLISTENDNNYCFQNNGTFSWTGGAIHSKRGVRLAGTSVTLDTVFGDCVHVNRFEFNCSNLTINGPIEFQGFRCSVTDPEPLSNLILTGASGIDLTNTSGLNNIGNGAHFTFTDFIYKLSSFGVNLRYNNTADFINAEVGSALDVTPASSAENNTNNGGVIAVYKKIKFNVKDLIGNNLQGAKVYFYTYDDGNRVDVSSSFGSGFDFTGTDIFSLTTDASGNTSTSQVLLVAHTLATLNASDHNTSFYSKNGDTTDLYTVDYYKYGFLKSQLDVSMKGTGEKTQEFVSLPDLSISEATKSTVNAYPVTVSIASNTITITGDSATVQNLTSAQLYDLLASHLEDNFGTYTNFFATRSGSEIDATGYNVNLSYINYTGDMVTDQVITLSNGSLFNGVRTDANGTVYPDQPISITNISAGSRMRIYNVTTGVETVNTVVSGTSYTSSYQEGTGYNDGDTVRVYLTKLGKKEWVGDVIDTSNGFSVLVSQVDDDVYTALGVDGTTVTKFQADYPNNEVDLIIGSDWTMAELYAWWANNLTTEDGIRNFFGGITAIDQANFRINTAIVNLFLDNTTSASYKQTDNRRFFRDTGTGYPVRNPTTSGYGLDVVWRNTILIAQTEAGGTSDLNFYDVKRAVKQVITNPKYIKGQK